jgi:hypothetical protein
MSEKPASDTSHAFALGVVVAASIACFLACNQGVPRRYLSIHEGMAKTEVIATLGLPSRTLEATQVSAELTSTCAPRASTVMEYSINEDSSLWVALNQSEVVECSSLHLHPIHR